MTDTNKTTLEQIKAAAKMGYGARLKWDEWKGLGTVVGIDKGIEMLGIKWDDDEIISRPFKDMIAYEITSYLYVGHLFGEPVIPEGQRFRVKEDDFVESGTVGVFVGMDDDKIMIDIEDEEGPLIFSKWEIEPVFT